jgi:hypothetical protein
MPKPPSLALAAYVAIAFTSPVLAQSTLAAGDRIRLSYAPLTISNAERKPDPIVAVFARVHGDSIYAIMPPLRDTGVFAIRALSQLDISRSRYNPVARGTVIGAMIGAVTGFGYGYLRAGAPQTLCVGDCPKVSKSSRAQNGGRTLIIGSSVGLLIGLFVGRTTTVDQWERVDLQMIPR